jgi:hypothetical protein
MTTALMRPGNLLPARTGINGLAHGGRQTRQGLPSHQRNPTALGPFQVRLVDGEPGSTVGRIRPRTRIDRFLSSPQRVDVGMIGAEAGVTSGPLGIGAVAGDKDIDVPSGVIPAGQVQASTRN